MISEEGALSLDFDPEDSRKCNPLFASVFNVLDAMPIPTDAKVGGFMAGLCAYAAGEYTRELSGKFSTLEELQLAAAAMGTILRSHFDDVWAQCVVQFVDAVKRSQEIKYFTDRNLQN